MEHKGFRTQWPDPESAMVWARLAATLGARDSPRLAGEIRHNQPSLAKPGESADAYFHWVLGPLQAEGKGLDSDPFELPANPPKDLVRRAEKAQAQTGR